MNMVSIIIPNYNGGDLLYNCIDSIYKNISIKDFEIIVVDNGSTDNSINRVKSNFQNVEIISSNSNLGYSGGCNLGAVYSKGNFLLFLNNDTTHKSGWIKPLINSLINNESISSVQPKILNMKDRFNILDTYAIIKELQNFNSYRVNNIYDIDNKTFLIKFDDFDQKRKCFIISYTSDIKTCYYIFLHFKLLFYSTVLGYKILNMPRLVML